MQVNRADFLELSQEILGHGGVLRFKASGDSMRPFIEWGDVIIVEPVNGFQLHIGDVIFYRCPSGVLIAHRLIKIHVGKSKTVLVTKGDALDYFDPPLRSEQVLGKVIAVERGGRYLRLNSGMHKVVGRSWARLSPMSRWLRPILRPGWRLCRRFAPARWHGLLELGMSSIQGISLYRRVARPLRTGIEIKEADAEDLQQAHGCFNFERTGHTVSKNPNVTCFVAKRGGRVIGSVDLVRRAEECYPFDGYWLHSLMVKTLYRGMGIGEILTSRAIERCRKEGAKGLSLLVFEHNNRAIELYSKLGFEMRVIPELEKQLENERRNLEHRRVFMFLCLS